MNKILSAIVLFFLFEGNLIAQQKTAGSATGNIVIPISNAELGTFPYFKTLPNFKPTNDSDSITIVQNRTYFFDGKAVFTVDGQVSCQRLNIINREKKMPSEFQIIQEFDRMVATLGGIKIYQGLFPENQYKSIPNSNDLDSRHQVAPNTSSYGLYDGGVIEYVIKTPQKEVWIQLVPSSIKSGFYNLLVVEKQNALLSTNINKRNVILENLEKNSKATTNLSFELDKTTMLSESKDELLNIVAIFQTHPDWKVKIEINNALVGKPEYILALTEKRAVAMKEELIALGVKSNLIEIKGLGDTKPLVPNDTEKARQTNTRIEISKF